MKKTYFFILSLFIGLTASTQVGSSNRLFTKKDFSNHKVETTNNNGFSRGAVLWSSDFSNPGDWDLTHTTGAGFHNVDWAISTDPSVVPVSALSPFASSSASNGFLYIDSDANNTGDADGTTIDAFATTFNPIDLSGEPLVILEFQHNYRWWQDLRIVSVSGDNGATWTDFQISDASGNLVGAQNQNTENPEITRFDISSIAGGQSQVKIRFNYNDQDYWAWYWVVDDVKITRKDSHNVKNLAAWIYGSSTNFAEYGRTPLSQLDQDWYIGCQVTNDGTTPQENVVLNADFGSFNATANLTGPLDPDSTRSFETLETIPLTIGTYQGSYTVYSDSDAIGGPNFGDNVLERNFEITNNTYALDGIGNHPTGNQILESFGTNSFYADNTQTTLATDGIVYATHYPFVNTDTINSVTALITSSTLEFSQVILYILDSTDLMTVNFGNAIYASNNPYDVTATDVANGFITIPVDDGSGYLEIPPGSYYAALELYSAGGSFDIRLISDATVNQPPRSSVLYIPGDAQTYTNPNACAIRFNLGPVNTTGIKENTEDISVFPNPSNGLVNIELENGLNTNIIIRDITGKVVQELNINSSTSIDLNNYGKGIYLFEINSDEKLITRKITIQ
jgi:hypothetical protein